MARYTVDSARRMVTDEPLTEYLLSTDSEDDPAIGVVEDEDGMLTYRYPHAAAEVTVAHRRAAAAAIAAYRRTREEV